MAFFRDQTLGEAKVVVAGPAEQAKNGVCAALAIVVIF